MESVPDDEQKYLKELKNKLIQMNWPPLGLFILL